MYVVCWKRVAWRIRVATDGFGWVRMDAPVGAGTYVVCLKRGGTGCNGRVGRIAGLRMDSGGYGWIRVAGVRTVCMFNGAWWWCGNGSGGRGKCWRWVGVGYGGYMWFAGEVGMVSTGNEGGGVGYVLC